MSFGKIPLVILLILVLVDQECFAAKRSSLWRNNNNYIKNFNDQKNPKLSDEELRFIALIENLKGQTTTTTTTTTTEPPIPPEEPPGEEPPPGEPPEEPELPPGEEPPPEEPPGEEPPPGEPPEEPEEPPGEEPPPEEPPEEPEEPPEAEPPEGPPEPPGEGRAIDQNLSGLNVYGYKFDENDEEDDDNNDDLYVDTQNYVLNEKDILTQSQTMHRKSPNRWRRRLDILQKDPTKLGRSSDRSSNVGIREHDFRKRRKLLKNQKFKQNEYQHHKKTLYRKSRNLKNHKKRFKRIIRSS